MTSELFIYDRDQGLFKEVLKQSTVMQGRYYILDNAQMNAANYGQYIAEALNGLSVAAQKYPVCLCMPPRSQPENKETFLFNLFFLTRSGATGQNQIKEIDIDTQVSTHHSWQDWKDMKECAWNFLQALKKTIRTRVVTISIENHIPLRSFISLDPTGIDITRLSNIGTDNVSGVQVSFKMEMTIDCALHDYPDELNVINIPPLTIHPLHKH
jgi:hypothetical protein